MKSHIVASASAAMLAIVSAVGGAEPESPPDWQPYFRELARSYRITPQSAPEEPLTLHEPPVLRWTQPVRGGDDGALYVWVKDGEPAVVETMFCWPDAEGYRVVVNEFHSLLTEPLTALREGTVAWAPEQGGITWKLFEDAPAPGGTAAQRLLQMRRLANRFRGENLDDGSGKRWELRLLPQPLYRFDLSRKREESKTATLDGALFTLASGTDPEILILIAARATDEGDRWTWALARFSDRPLTAWLDAEKIWSVERAQPTRSKPHTYFEVDRLVQPPEIADE